MIHNIHIKDYEYFITVLRKARYHSNLFIERINSFKNHLKSNSVSWSIASEGNEYVEEQIKRKGISSHSNYRGSNESDFFTLGNYHISVTNI